METGVYCLVFGNGAVTLGVGRLGAVPFREGFHVYVGSALGPGGLSRVGRHRRLARERDRPQHWHVDALLLDPRFRLVAVVTAPTCERCECDLARALGGESVGGFGATDCRCGSHLFHRDADPAGEVAGAFRRIGLAPVIDRANDNFEKAMATDGDDL